MPWDGTRAHGGRYRRSAHGNPTQDAAQTRETPQQTPTYNPGVVLGEMPENGKRMGRKGGKTKIWEQDKGGRLVLVLVLVLLYAFLGLHK